MSICTPINFSFAENLQSTQGAVFILVLLSSTFRWHQCWPQCDLDLVIPGVARSRSWCVTNTSDSCSQTLRNHNYYVICLTVVGNYWIKARVKALFKQFSGFLVVNCNIDGIFQGFTISNVFVCILCPVSTH